MPAHTPAKLCNAPQTGCVTRRSALVGGAASVAAFAGLGLLPRRAHAAVATSTANVDELIAAMTRRQKIEQMLMPDFRQWMQNGKVSDLTVLNEEIAGVIDSYDLGGVILFANNVKQTDQTLKLAMDMQQAALRNTAQAPAGDIPLLLTIDQEGGIVYRLGSGTALPGSMAVGATRSDDDALQCGQVIGRELDALKLNVNFAPSFDVNNNPNNPVIGLRSYSSDPELVSKLGTSMMAGMQEHGIATAAKHFPGHGDAGTDSHTGLPRIEKTKQQLEELEFIPFRAAIDAGVDMVMTAHIQYPKVETTKVMSQDPAMGEIELPATLSPVFMTDILRTEMGFTGVSVTDALNMDAISKNFGYIDAVKRTFKAGVDIALMPVTLRSMDDVPKLEELVQALEDDAELTDERLNTSVRRILELKKRRGILAYKDEAGTYEENLVVARAQVGSEQNRSIEREVAADAITVVKNDGGVLPMKPQAGDHILLVAAWANERPGMELSMRRLLSEGVIKQGVTYESINYADGFEDMDEAVRAITEKIAAASHVVVISEIGSAANLDPDKKSGSSAYVPTRVVQAANAAGKPVAVLSISKPYDAAAYPDAPAIAIAYGNKGMDPTEGLAPTSAFGPNVPAGVEVIFGGHAAQGKLPVDVFAIKRVDGKTTIDTGNVVYQYGFGLEYDKVTDRPAVDTSALAAAIARVEKDILPHKKLYTAASFAALTTALEQARKTLANGSATQADVDAALRALNDAVSGLVKAGGSASGNGDGKPGNKPTGTLPQTGDVSAAFGAAAAVAGAAAIAYGVSQTAEE
ncbi:MAG: glycoside hydrolase family 3 N-terminal domain-containing protein [Coriobacteriaceae bacterium]|nr:glycoside hydrolase family 3 N-terminal domain-containing protein [Coriobacteriaceae bacterium]